MVVVGGSSGIGLRVAQLAADEGAQLLIVGRDSGRLQAAQADLQARGATVGTYQVDAHDHTALAALFDELPAFDHLVSMIGDVMGGGFIGADIAVIRHVIESKFFTNLRIGQLAAAKVREGGSLVFTSGTGGRAQDACASYVGNLGINALAEGLAVELAPKRGSTRSRRPGRSRPSGATCRRHRSRPRAPTSNRSSRSSAPRGSTSWPRPTCS
ncbi:SDR family NAD(P)-dependent oxidoreductase [Xanthomonas euroxanthea]